jgi:DNA-directed RNA polymerase beta subunit
MIVDSGSNKINKKSGSQVNSNPIPQKNSHLLKKIKCEMEDNEFIKNIAKHHIDSFDYAMTEVLKKLPTYIKPLEIKSNEKTKDIFNYMLVSFENFELGMPVNDLTTNLKRSNELYPHECRERELNYSAPLYATIKRKIDNDYPESIKIKLGNIPVMVRSKFCNLYNKPIEKIVEHKEELHDFGGYFIIHGLEKLIRMTAIARRNYPIGFM